MARIDVLPSIDIIRGLKGILDFYIWKGLPCVRAWPKYRPARQSDASKAAALTFGEVIKAYSLLGHLPLEAYREAALDNPRTARDIMVAGVYGNLHEPTFPLPPPPPEEIVQIKTAFAAALFAAAGAPGYTDIANMQLVFTLASEGTICCVFSCQIARSVESWEYITLRFNLDDATFSEEYQKRADRVPANNERYVLTVHTVFEAVAPGLHTIYPQVLVEGGVTTNVWVRRHTALSLE